MKNFNSFNAQSKLEKKDDIFYNITYDKTGTSLDNIVDDLRNGYDENSFVAPDGAYKVDLWSRLRVDGSYSQHVRQEPISAVLKLDNDNYIVTHAGFMGLVRTNKEGGEARLDELIDMRGRDEDFNPYKGITIGQPLASGSIPVALTVFNRGNRLTGNTDNAEYQKFRKGLSRQIINYYKNML